MAFLLAILAGCATSGSSEREAVGANLGVIGDDRGGKINGGASAGNTTAAMAQVTSHCAKFGKKGSITRMDFDTGLLVFECLEQRGKSGL